MMDNNPEGKCFPALIKNFICIGIHISLMTHLIK